jgi:hypothetical protein
VVLIALVLVACAPMNEQQIEEILSGVAQTAAAGVTFVPPEGDVGAIVAGTLTAMAAQPVAPPADTPVPPPLQLGSIGGALSYPSEFIPAQQVVAFRVGSADYAFVLTQQGQGTYQIDNLTPGSYHVVAYLMDGSLSAGYSQAVPCGLSVNCTDHSLIDVVVNGGQVTSGVNPSDWYAPPGSFPAKP